MVAGIQQDTWFLLAIGALGMIHNILVAGWVRTPKAHGIPLNPSFEDIARQDVTHKRIMEALKAVEDAEPGIDLVLVYVFFPDSRSLRPEERKDWDDKQSTLKERRGALKRAQAGPTPTAQRNFRDHGTQTSSRSQGSSTLPTPPPGTNSRVNNNHTVLAGSEIQRGKLPDRLSHGDPETNMRYQANDATCQAGPSTENAASSDTRS
jgi:hypothetical protein